MDERDGPLLGRRGPTSVRSRFVRVGLGPRLVRLRVRRRLVRVQRVQSIAGRSEHMHDPATGHGPGRELRAAERREEPVPHEVERHHAIPLGRHGREVLNQEQPRSVRGERLRLEVSSKAEPLIRAVGGQARHDDVRERPAGGHRGERGRAGVDQRRIQSVARDGARDQVASDLIRRLGLAGRGIEGPDGGDAGLVAAADQDRPLGRGHHAGRLEQDPPVGGIERLYPRAGGQEQEICRGLLIRRVVGPSRTLASGARRDTHGEQDEQADPPGSHGASLPYREDPEHPPDIRLVSEPPDTARKGSVPGEGASEDRFEGPCSSSRSRRTSARPGPTRRPNA
jgi:hypothetical protein